MKSFRIQRRIFSWEIHGLFRFSINIWFNWFSWIQVSDYR